MGSGVVYIDNKCLLLAARTQLLLADEQRAPAGDERLTKQAHKAASGYIRK